MRNATHNTLKETEEVTILFVTFKIPEMQRLSYDLSPLYEINVPIIWLVGPPGSGRDTQATIIEDAYGFDVIKIGQLLKKHSSNETDRGRVIKENIDERDSILIPNTIVLDILKEEMLYRARWSCGYLLNGFPRNRDQAAMFVEEILPVDVIIYLDCSLKILVERILVKHEGISYADAKKSIINHTKELGRGLKKYNAIVEKFNTSAAPDVVFPRIQSALNIRVFGDAVNKAD